jgi:hypothetical protein
MSLFSKLVHILLGTFNYASTNLKISMILTDEVCLLFQTVQKRDNFKELLTMFSKERKTKNHVQVRHLVLLLEGKNSTLSFIISKQNMSTL